MAKDSYIRFRCTEAQKARIEASAMQAGCSVSEYLLNLAEDDHLNYLHEESLFLEINVKGKQYDPIPLGTYLFDASRRASKYTTFKELMDKCGEELAKKPKTSRTFKITSDRGGELVTNAFSDFCWME